jgi:hypothetical protein
MIQYATIEEAWQRSPAPIRRVYPRDSGKFTEPLPELSSTDPQPMFAPSSSSKYDRLEGQRPRDLPDSMPRPLTPEETEAVWSASTQEERLHRPFTEAVDIQTAESRQPSEQNDSAAMYDIILYGISGVVLVMILEQFVQMGISLRRPR